MLLQGVRAKVGMGLGAAVCLVSALMAAAAIWLFLTEPVSVATALDSGDIGRLATAVFGVVVTAIRSLAGYL
jgi:hypothetical protein